MQNWQRLLTKYTLGQLFGALLMFSGILSLALALAFMHPISPNVLSILFFLIMLGLSLAFPSLLEGNSGISTMRVVVFMMTNVICMLLLKIGWGKNVHTLGDIGLDANWVGVIAFVFGAKATQSYFENMSRKGTPDDTASDKPQGMAAVPFSNSEVAKLAVQQNEQYLKLKFPNILSVSDAVLDLTLDNSHVVALYVRDKNTSGMPTLLEVHMPNGSLRTIDTEIITDVGTPSLQIGQTDLISNSNSNYSGSICCMVCSADDENFKGVVTAGHVYSSGQLIDKAGQLAANDATYMWVNNQDAGTWCFQTITESVDMAIADISKYAGLNDLSGLLSFKDKAPYSVSDTDVLKTTVTIKASKTSDKQGYILDYNVVMDYPYNNGLKFQRMSNLIVIGSKQDRNNAQTISMPGDSGGCIFNSVTGQLIGMVLGGNNKFTYVLPVDSVLSQFDYKII